MSEEEWTMRRDVFKELEDFFPDAISKGLSFYVYKYGNSRGLNTGASFYPCSGLSRGFVIGSFDGDPRHTITIPHDIKSRDLGSVRYIKVEGFNGDTTFYPFPKRSTTRDEHIANVKAAVKALEGHPDRKIVMARTLVDETPDRDNYEELARIYRDLCLKYPDAYTFIYYTPFTGVYIGATPEVLCHGGNGEVGVMSLAGTRPAGSEGKWDDKDRREQQIVTDYLLDIMSTQFGESHSQAPETRKAGNVEHLLTWVSSPLPKILSYAELHEFIERLSPTPALCGLPKEEAMNFIKSREDFERGYYGGYLGETTSGKGFHLRVNLRSARVERHRIAYFAGGGITEQSDPKKEWRETEMKIATLREVIEKGKS